MKRKNMQLESIRLLFLIFHIFSYFYVGSMCLMRRLHLARSCASSLDNSLSDKSFLILLNHLRFGLHLLLFPGTSIPITLLPIFVFSSQYMPIPLQPTFLHFLRYFSHLRCPSNSFIHNSVQRGNMHMRSNMCSCMSMRVYLVGRCMVNLHR